MRQHIIRFTVPGIAAAVDDLRDTLAAVAGPQLVSRADPNKRDHWYRSPRHLYWREQKLNTLRLRTLLHQLGIVFRDAQGRPMKPPANVLSTFLSVAATYDWFAPGECGAWMRANNPPGRGAA